MTGAADLVSLVRLLAALPGVEVVEGANLGTTAVVSTATRGPWLTADVPPRVRQHLDALARAEIDDLSRRCPACPVVVAS